MAVQRHQFTNPATSAQSSYWVADTAAEAVTGAVEGDLKYAKDTDQVYSYDGSAWDSIGSSSGPTLPTIRSVGAETTGTGALSVPLGAGHTTNDINVIVAQSANEIVAVPVGYQRVGPQSGIGASAAAGSTRLSVFWKRDGGAETDPITVNDAGEHTYAFSFCVTGCPTTGDPFHYMGNSWKFTTSTTGTAKGGATYVDNCLIVDIFAHAVDQAGANSSGEANADLASVTEKFDDSTTDGNGGGLVLISGTKTKAGPFTGTTVTWATTSVDVSMTLAFIPSDAVLQPKPTEVQVFIGSATALAQVWQKPSGAKAVEIVAIGAGGSGSAGRNAAVAAGGGGGGGGGYDRAVFRAADLPATLTITTGTAGAATANTDGAVGAAGGASQIALSSTFLVAALGGGAGAASATGSGGAGGYGAGFQSGTPAVGAAIEVYGSLGAPGGTGVTTAASGSRSNDFAGGGGAGGGTTAAATQGGVSRKSGGGGGGGRSNTNVAAGGAGGGAAQTAAVAGTNGTDSPDSVRGGSGGTGGTSAAGPGGNGGFPGGGGGGGGSQSGAQRGGAGGHGAVTIITYF